MNTAQIHLLLNHVPLMGSLMATAILAWGLFRKNEEIIRLSCYLFIGSALVALPVYFSGEGAEEAVEHLPGVLESLIHEHEELAEIAIIIMEALGLGALGGLIASFRLQRVPMWLGVSLLIGGLVNGGVMAQTAHLGGLIRHSEIRAGQSQTESLSSSESREQSAKVEAHSEKNEHSEQNEQSEEKDHDD